MRALPSSSPLAPLSVCLSLRSPFYPQISDLSHEISNKATRKPPNTSTKVTTSRRHPRIPHLPPHPPPPPPPAVPAKTTKSGKSPDLRNRRDLSPRSNDRSGIGGRTARTPPQRGGNRADRASRWSNRAKHHLRIFSAGVLLPFEHDVDCRRSIILPSKRKKAQGLQSPALFGKRASDPPDGIQCGRRARGSRRIAYHRACPLQG